MAPTPVHNQGFLISNDTDGYASVVATNAATKHDENQCSKTINNLHPGSILKPTFNPRKQVLPSSRPNETTMTEDPSKPVLPTTSQLPLDAAFAGHHLIEKRTGKEL